MKLCIANHLAILLLTVGLASGVSAATFTVNHSGDAADILPGDGICQTAIPAQCTLRAATQEANALPGGDSVIVPAGSYSLSLGQLSITDDLNMSGEGPDATIINGDGATRVLLVENPPVSPRITVTVEGVTIQNGGDLAAIGAGILVDFGTTVNLTDSVVRNNSAPEGAGVWINFDGILNITNSIISHNNAFIAGGGIRNSGKLTVRSSTVSNNTPSGIVNSAFDDEATIINSTLSGNVSDLVNDGAPISIVNSTLTNALLNLGGGPFVGVVRLKNTVITGGCVGAITSDGHNLSSDDSCGLTSPGDLINTDPLLGPLQNNGGPTETHALLPGSPAIDAVAENCTDLEGDLVLTDQRGEPRPADGNGDGNTACDIGAFEVQLALVTVDIDIKPRNEANPVNPRARGVLKVAVITTENFDASTVDVGTVGFGPASAASVWYRFDDVDYDGDLDLALKFRTQDTGIACGDTEATLTGKTFGDVEITGTDSLKTVGCPK